MALLRQSVSCFRHCAKQTIFGNTRTCNMKRWVAPTLRELERRRIRVGPLPVKRRNTFLEWNYNAEIYAFSKRLREDFNEDLLRRAFVHSSYRSQQEVSDSQEEIQDNKHLIQEGDRFILQYIRTKFQKNYHEDLVEVVLNYLTSNEMLSHVAFHLGVKDLIFSSDYPPETLTLANTFKALVAALKESTSQEKVEKFIDDFLICQMHDKNVYELWDLKNPYEYLQNLAGKNGYKEIEPRLCNQSAINTILANYQIGLYSNKKLLGIGWGESIEVAKNMAAVNAIEKLHKLT